MQCSVLSVSFVAWCVVFGFCCFCVYYVLCLVLVFVSCFLFVASWLLVVRC